MPLLFVILYVFSSVKIGFARNSVAARLTMSLLAHAFMLMGPCGRVLCVEKCWCRRSVSAGCGSIWLRSRKTISAPLSPVATVALGSATATASTTRTPPKKFGHDSVVCATATTRPYRCGDVAVACLTLANWPAAILGTPFPRFISMTPFLGR